MVYMFFFMDSGLGCWRVEGLSFLGLYLNLGFGAQFPTPVQAFFLSGLNMYKKGVCLRRQRG